MKYLLALILYGNVINITPQEIQEYQLNQVIEKLIACESSGNPLAWNKDDGAEGEHSIGNFTDEMENNSMGF